MNQLEEKIDEEIARALEKGVSKDDILGALEMALDRYREQFADEDE